MLFPTTVVDNYFNDPDRIVEYSKKLEWGFDPEGKWPGQRSSTLGEVDYDFFSFHCNKLLSVIYPENTNDITYVAESYFQKISSEYNNGGWIHCDEPKELTAIVYLSHHKNCGTNIYEHKHHFPIQKHLEEKKKVYKSKDFSNEKKFLLENNENYEESISVKSKYNRLILFDSYLWHGANHYVDKENLEDRLTLVTFFHSINKQGIKYPVSQMRRY